MNRYQEALDYLAVSLQVFDETVDDKPYRDELEAKRENARKELQELVYKATSKEPKNWKAERRLNGKVEFNCPVCNRLYTERVNFCASCGQRIDWSEDDDISRNH